MIFSVLQWWGLCSSVLLIVLEPVKGFHAVGIPSTCWMRRHHFRRDDGQREPVIDNLKPIQSANTCGDLALFSHKMGDSAETTSCLNDRRQCLTSAAVFVSAAVALTSASGPSRALSPEQASKDYDTYSSTYNDLDGGDASTILGIDQARSALFQQARGAVLEIGAGTGLNLNKYCPSQLTSLTLVDISEGMLQEAQKRIQATPSLKGVPVTFIKADATSSELVDRFGPQAFDTVVDSFSLCVMGNEGAAKCLDQLSKVVKSKSNGGQVLLLENSRSSNPLLGLYQDATAEAAASAGGKGCVYNQDVAKMIRATRGMSIEAEDLYVAGLFRGFRCTVSSGIFEQFKA